MMSAISRRSLLTGLAATGAVTTLTLSGCRSDDTPLAGSTTPPSTADGVLPTYVADSSVTADLPSEFQGGMHGFFSYPAEPVAAFDAPPLSGGTITALTFTYDPIAPGMSDNSVWQGINEGLGATLDLEYAPSADYRQRFSTTLAGNDLPDLLTVQGSVPQLPSMLKSQCIDLTEHLAGDAVGAYPHLAALATDSWRSCVVDGALWGVPVSRPPVGNISFLRKDLADKAGLPAQPRNYAEFRELLVGLTNLQQNRWASSQMTSVAGFLAASLGVANRWSQDSGVFTMQIARPEYEQALADTIELVRAGVFHPDGLASNNNQRNDWFTNGSCPIVMAGFVGWPKFEMWGADVDGFELGAILPFGHDDGMEPSHQSGTVTPNYTVIPKGSQDRIGEMLTALDWLAAPFGTREYLLRKYGTDGVTFNLDGSDPVLNSTGQNERLVPFQNVSDGPQVIYDPGLQRASEARFTYQESALPMMAEDPILGLYSETASSKNSSLNTVLDDALKEILQERRPLSDWADVVAQWKSEGGDQMRSEYEAAYAQLNG